MIPQREERFSLQEIIWVSCKEKGHPEKPDVRIVIMLILTRAQPCRI